MISSIIDEPDFRFYKIIGISLCIATAFCGMVGMLVALNYQLPETFEIANNQTLSKSIYADADKPKLVFEVHAVSR